MEVFSRGLQESILNPDEFKGKSISVIGAGATGSYLVTMLAKAGIGTKGCGDIKVFDFDVVEKKNLLNQDFEPKHVDMLKATALAEKCLENYGSELKVYDMRVKDQKEAQSTYVFLLTDTMSSRAEIVEEAMKYAVGTDLIIETRMSATEGRIYAFNPNNRAELEEWKNTLYSDDEAETSLCGTEASIAVSPSLLANLAFLTFAQHFNANHSRMIVHKDDSKKPFYFEFMYSVMPFGIVAREFGKEPQFFPGLG